VKSGAAIIAEEALEFVGDWLLNRIVKIQGIDYARTSEKDCPGQYSSSG
jgi:hypothetical protein